MASSRIVLSPLGWSALVGGLSALLIGLVTLNLLLLIVPLAVLALTATELLAFDRATRGFGPSWFRWQRFENSSEVRIDGVGSMALDLERVGPGSGGTDARGRARPARLRIPHDEAREPLGRAGHAGPLGRAGGGDPPGTG